MWVLIDNYDSFTHILHHYLVQAGGDCVVCRNDELTLDGLIRLQPERLIISPGPGRPENAGITMEAVAHFYDKIPILGICLGHQALGLHFGAQLVHAPEPVHGKVREVHHGGHALFAGLPNPFPAMRYHSLSLTGMEGTGLLPIAHTSDEVNMAVMHERYPCIGFQAHPESVGTPDGLRILQNWVGIDG
ncbi:MAG TPA: aminodeoxychorismate/anthranilate synthase component II [Flavitalea sp.]|nr:aminodeoxychorismate/anthranilate synthase component II [Flavitalea sp.]